MAILNIKNFPDDLYEAAEIDGAGRWAQFRHVTWPQLAPTTFFILIISLIGGLQGGFEQARVMTAGGPAGPGDGEVRPSRDLRGATLMGTEFRTLALLNPSWRLDGRYPSPGEPAGVLGSALARRAGLSNDPTTAVQKLSTVVSSRKPS